MSVQSVPSRLLLPGLACGMQVARRTREMSGAPFVPPSSPPLPLTVPFAVTIRICREDDLSALEWEGMFSDHRDIILDAFIRQQQRSNVMFVAETRGRIVGQVWIDLTKLASRGAGFLWALRVHPDARGCGIGTELVGAAEAWLSAQGFESGALGVEKDNVRGMRLYRRLGYDVAGELVQRYTYSMPEGDVVEVTVDQWLLEKRLLTPGVRQ
jgi:ribosomal protein S18 acetylase RimI-like enzyme